MLLCTHVRIGAPLMFEKAHSLIGCQYANKAYNNRIIPTHCDVGYEVAGMIEGRENDRELANIEYSPSQT